MRLLRTSVGVSVGATFLGLAALDAPRRLYLATSPDGRLEPPTVVEVGVLRIALAAAGALLVAAAFAWYLYVVTRLGVPFPPLELVPFGVLAALLDEHTIFARLWGSPPWRLSEARETLFAVLLLAAVAIDLRRRKAPDAQTCYPVGRTRRSGR